jgi:tetratricopeptide (TPR) repeat protein
MRNRSVLCAVMTWGCAPSIQLRVLEPAEIMVPPHVVAVTVVDRSTPKNLGQGILGVLEGALTGESLGAELRRLRVLFTEGRHEAVHGLEDVLHASPRFEVHPDPGLELDANLFDQVMPWKEAKAICKAAACDGVIALEAFDSDAWVEIDELRTTEMDEGKERVVVTYEATRETEVVTSWRLYDVANKVVADDLQTFSVTRTWGFVADTEQEAREGLPSDNETVAAAGWTSGQNYGVRIAPTYVWVNRTFFGAGDERLKEAKLLVNADQWNKAIKIWERLFEGAAEDKIKARAAYNLALAREREGSLEAAIRWQGKAARHWPKGRIVTYASTLEHRRQEALRLEEQMGSLAE